MIHTLRVLKRFSGSIKIENPYSFEIIAEVPYISYAQAESQLAASVTAFHSWRSTPLQSRISIISKALNYFDSNKSEIAKEITLQMGKPYKQSLKEITSSISIAKSLISLAPLELSQEIIDSSGSSSKLIEKEPIGPVFLLVPYNYPVLSIMSTLIPAVLAGNSVLIKSSPYTPLSALHFSKAFEEQGLKDLVQDCFISTDDVSKILVKPDISYAHLIGSSDTGRTLYREVAHASFIDIGLFLSSNNGVYIAEDTNISTAASQIIKNSMENAGQTSFRFNRVFVHKSNYESFLSSADPLVRSYTIGDPIDEITNLGPITEPDTIDTLQKSIEEAVSNGADVICGGNCLNDENGKGRFFEPTIVTNVDDSLSFMVRDKQQYENFGPVLIVECVENDKEAIRRINSTDYGLIGGVYCEDKKKAEDIVREICAGSVLVNSTWSFDGRMPVSGRKLSGRNTSYSRFSFAHFYRTKAVFHKFTL